MIDMIWIVVGVGGFVGLSIYRAYKGGGEPSTHRKLDPSEQSRIVVNTIGCAGCAPTQTFLKGKDKIMVTLQPPGDGKPFVKEYHRTELEADPIGLLMGRIQVNEKYPVPILGTQDSAFEEPEETVKRQIENHSGGRQFEADQRNFFDAAEAYVKKFREEKMQPPTVDRDEEAVDRVFANGSQPDELEPEPTPAVKRPLRKVDKAGREFFVDGINKGRISKAEFERLLAEAKDARR